MKLAPRSRRDALQRWADHVDAVVRGEPAGKVVPIGMAMKPTASR
jgi:hypothetical protein